MDNTSEVMHLTFLCHQIWLIISDQSSLNNILTNIQHCHSKFCCCLATWKTCSQLWLSLFVLSSLQQWPTVWLVSIGLRPPHAAGQHHESVWGWGQQWCCWRGERESRSRTLPGATATLQRPLTWLLPWERGESADALHQECHFSHSAAWWGENK